MGFESLLLMEDRFSSVARLSDRQKRYIKKIVHTNKELINRPDFYERLSKMDADNKTTDPYFKVLVSREICTLLDSNNCPVIP